MTGNDAPAECAESSAPAHRNTAATHRPASVLTVIIAAAAVALAACGSGSSSPHVASIGSSQGNSGAGGGTPTATTGSTAAVNGVPVDPKVFANGACVSYGPTSGDNHRTVFLDAGHGGIDPGAQGVTETGKTIYEAGETLPVELDTMALLRAQGYRVVVSRIDNSNVARFTAADLENGALSAAGVHVDVADRDICANMAKANILIGIYFDAGTSSNAGSITGYDTVRPFAADNLRLADLMQRDVLASMNSHGWQIPDDGVVSDTELGGPPLTEQAAAYGHLLLLGPADPPWFTTPSQMPGALIEPLFITDPFEGSIAASPAGQQAIAHGLAEAVEQYFSGA